MSKLLKRKNLTIITNVFLAFIIAGVTAVCFAPLAVPASAPVPYYNGDRGGDKISIMFNVYEGADVVGGIMDTLGDYGVKATFFMGGCFADDNAELLNRMVDEGHEIANHGYFHLEQDRLSIEKNREEIFNTGKIITALCGAEPKLFAPPSGAFSSNTLKAADELGYTVVLWSKDTVDWRDSDEEKIFRRATKNARAGDLVLMHPKAHTLSVLPKILDAYNSIGLKQSTVSETLFGE